MIREKHGVAILLVSHNIGVVANLADRIGVLYQGKLVEYGARDRVIGSPRHEYTARLLAAVPTL